MLKTKQNLTFIPDLLGKQIQIYTKIKGESNKADFYKNYKRMRKK